MENQEEQTTPQAAPELTITDLQNIRSIIDAASRRGAFGASEMAAIGSVFNKLDAFLNAVAPAQQAADSQPEA
jgi:hypothetical protein